MTVGAVAGEPATVELMSTALESVRKVVDFLSPEQAWATSNGDLIRLLQLREQHSAALAALDAHLVREADVRGLAAGEGQPSTQAWLAKLLKLTPGEAKARVKAAGVLATKASGTAAALRDGKLNADQGRAVAKALGGIADDTSDEEFAQAEKLLRREGRGLHAKEIERAGRSLKDIFDPDGTQPREDRAWRSRDLTIIDIGGGRHRIAGTLTDEGATTLKAALDPLAAPRPAEDGTPDPRSPGQRNHDALIELAATFLRFTDLPKSHGSAPHLHLTVSIETLKGDTGHPHARTATGEDLTIETIRRIACDAGITPIVANTLGVPLAVGRESRLWTPAIWAALVARDLGCVFPGCTRPASWCHGHHITHWINDGETELKNGALLCHFHHHVVHHQHWQIRLGPDGHPELIPPPWIDPLQQPRRNTHWKLVRDGLREEPDRGP
jgi:hypothetical protein